MKKIIDAAASTITFKFDIPADADEVTRASLAPIVFDPAKMSDANRAFAVLHGMSARIGDAAALTRGDAPGHKVTEAMRQREVASLVDHYHSGSVDWSPGRMGAKATPLNPAVLALAQARGLTYEAAQAWIAEVAIKEMSAASESAPPAGPGNEGTV